MSRQHFQIRLSFSNSTSVEKSTEMSALQNEQSNSMSGGNEENGNAAGLETEPAKQAQLCSICLLPPIEPVETKCGHTYCLDCLDTLVCTADCIPRCPLCRREI